MSDKKHIDRLFQEKFKDFDVKPNDALWEGIEARLEKKKKRRVIPIWWQFGGVAAALVLLFTIGNTLINNTRENKNNPVIVDTKGEDVKTNDSNEILTTIPKGNNTVVSSNTASDTDNSPSEASTKKNSENQKMFTSNNVKKDAIVASQNSKSSTEKTNSSEITFEIKDKKAVASNTKSKVVNDKEDAFALELKSKSELKKLIQSTTKTSDAVASANTINEKENAAELLNKNKEEEKGQSIEDAIAEANTINEKEEEQLRRWSIAPNVAPVLFNSFGQGSSIDDQFNNNNRTSDVSLSYGIKGSYAVNNRLRVTAGINRVNFNSTTNDIIALSDNSFASRTNDNTLENVELNSSVNNESLTLLSRTSINDASIPGAINTLQTGDLNQNFGFIEIPLELEYRILDKDIGINLSGGFSTLFLNENEIFADINGQSSSIGEANNINSTSFSANFGIGLDYRLTDKVNINLEPKFKYQLNTFNNTSGDFRPFFIGVYTGLSFKF